MFEQIEADGRFGLAEALMRRARSTGRLPARSAALRARASDHWRFCPAGSPVIRSTISRRSRAGRSRSASRRSFQFRRIAVAAAGRQACDFAGDFIGLRRAVIAHWRVGQFAQAAQFIAAADGGQDEELPPLRVLVHAHQRAARRHLRGCQCRVRTARRLVRQDHDHDGEKYAAHWDDPKKRQHHLCITESAKTPKQTLHTFRRIVGAATRGASQ